ncbi:uncharacterized protein LOC144152149 [Haemaphysalis longicornis]
MACSTTAVILLFLASASATQTTSPGSCSFADEDLERVIENDLIAKLPAVRRSTKGFYEPSGEVTTVNGTIEGVDSFRLFGPLLPYCRNGTRAVQFDLVNERPLSIEISRRTENKFITTAKLLRLTVQCLVEGSGQGLRLRRKAEVPVAVVLQSSEGKGSVGAIFERQFQQGPTNFWYKVFFVDFEALLKQLLP